MNPWLVVYSDERELDLDQLKASNVGLLKAGPGKMRTATVVTSYLTSSLRARKVRPRVITAGTCMGLEEGLTGTIVRPSVAIDRDATPEVLKMVGLEPGPVVRLDEGDAGIVIGTGEGLVVDPRRAEVLRAKGVQVVDMETYAVGWASIRCLTGLALAVRYVINDAWVDGRDLVDQRSVSLATARESLTKAVLQLTDD